jgi:NitT/TauT family transport system substrate-binding protein
MKKLIGSIAALVLLIGTLFAFASCDRIFPKKDEDTVVKVVVPDGAPILSVTKLWSEDLAIREGFKTEYSYLNGADALVSTLLAKEPDIAIAPINVCATMYNNGSGYRFAGVSIWGIMHIVGNEAVSGVEGLSGKKILGFAESGTPGITLRKIITESGLSVKKLADNDDSVSAGEVGILYLADAPTIVSDLVGGISGFSFALLPEPVATAIAGATQNRYSVKINLQSEWQAKFGESYPQAGLIFHERLLADDGKKEYLNSFIAAIDMSAAWANANPREAGNIAVDKDGAIKSTGLPGGAPIETAVNGGRLPLGFTSVEKSKAAVNSYLTIIHASNPNLVGGSVPGLDSDFYYKP